MDQNGKDIPPLSQLLAPRGKWYSSSHFSNSTVPGTYFSYSNLCFGVLATILEKLSGQRFDIYMRQNVLLPLNVNASY